MSSETVEDCGEERRLRRSARTRKGTTIPSVVEGNSDTDSIGTEAETIGLA